MVAVLAASALAVPAPVPAAPSGTRVDAVFSRDRCKTQECQAGRDPQIATDSPVRGTIQIHVRSNASVLGLDWVRLEGRFCHAKVCDARTDDPRWACIEQWDSPGESSFFRSVDWETKNWRFPRGKSPPEPWGCTEGTWHWHGAPTENAWFTLRVTARERVNGEQQEWTGFRFRMANPVTPPTWGAKPVVSKDAAGRPTVTLEWKPNPEPDVVEYHFARAGPGGPAEYVIDGNKPERQGCRKIQAGKPAKVISLVCEDTAFPTAAFSGNFRYAVYAYRPAPSGKSCSLKPQPCYESAASSVRTVAVSAAGAGLGPSSAPTAVTPAATSAAAPAGGAPLAVAPGDRTQDLTPPAAATHRSAVPLVLAFLLLGGMASLSTWWIRARRREP
jgi:hypothetical protein